MELKKIDIKDKDDSIECHGITLLTLDVAIVDCIKNDGGSVRVQYENLYYITDKNGKHPEEF